MKSPKKIKLDGKLYVRADTVPPCGASVSIDVALSNPTRQKEELREGLGMTIAEFVKLTKKIAIESPNVWGIKSTYEPPSLKVTARRWHPNKGEFSTVELRAEQKSGKWQWRVHHAPISGDKNLSEYRFDRTFANLEGMNQALESFNELLWNIGTVIWNTWYSEEGRIQTVSATDK